MLHTVNILCNLCNFYSKIQQFSFFSIPIKAVAHRIMVCCLLRTARKQREVSSSSLGFSSSSLRFISSSLSVLARALCVLARALSILVQALPVPFPALSVLVGALAHRGSCFLLTLERRAVTRALARRAIIFHVPCRA